MEPLEFKPILKRIRWGGRRLGDVLHKPVGSEQDYAESWEIVDHGADQSVVQAGPFSGMTLNALLSAHHTSLLGPGKSRTQFPLLIKYLDANDTLSVQVHPNDEQAKQHDPKENGKTEAWVIIEADPESVVYAGLKPDVDAAAFKAHLQAGTVLECLHTVKVQPGDCLFIEAGTVHAIGAGILLAEIQQSSDLTYRLYDWGKLGSDGKPREIHIQQALACTDFERGPVSPVIPIHLSTEPHHCIEQLVNCQYFTIRRHHISADTVLPRDSSCSILMGLAGQGQIATEQTQLEFSLGKSLLIPADCSEIQIRPGRPMTLLEATIPG